MGNTASKKELMMAADHSSSKWWNFDVQSKSFSTLLAFHLEILALPPYEIFAKFLR
jgi:hypothetical protein